MQIIVSREILLFATLFAFFGTTVILSVIDIARYERLKQRLKRYQNKLRKEETPCSKN